MRRAALAALTTTFATGLRAARRLPRPRRALSTRAGAVKPTMGLESFAASADSSWTRCLNADPEASRHAPNKESRQVKSGHYVPVRPSPLPRASLALFSEELAADLGLSEADVRDARFARYFSGDADALDLGGTWATPYALSIMGEPHVRNCPFGNGNGYGDGRAVSVGEVVSEKGRYELQLKGGGKTPFCRGADGRAVLRSSLREFLASEAMHFLGVPTTRALSLVVSAAETSRRPWYSRRDDAEAPPEEDISEDDPRLAQFPLQMRRQLIRQLMAQRGGGSDPDIMIEEPCAITCRVAPSFARVGHVDLFARRAARGGDAETRELALLVQHAIAREYPDLLQGDGDATRVAPLSVEALRPVALAFAERARDRLATLAAEWLRVGFCQGNFNADNCLVAGRTMDYGPFGFVDKYDPGFAKWVGSGDHFAFANQPGAALANYGTLVRSLAPLFDDVAPLQEVADDAHAVFAEAVDDCYRKKLGFPDDVDPSGTARPSLKMLPLDARTCHVVQEDGMHISTLQERANALRQRSQVRLGRSGAASSRCSGASTTRSSSGSWPRRRTRRRTRICSTSSRAPPRTATSPRKRERRWRPGCATGAPRRRTARRRA